MANGYAKYSGIGGGSGGGGGVTSLNSLTGALNLVAGSNITITPSGSNITIASTGGSGSPGGTSGQVQYNNAGAFGGFGSWNGTTLAITGAISSTTTMAVGTNLHVFGTSILAGDLAVQGGANFSGNLGFYGASEIAQPTGNILTALSNLGLVATPTMPISSVTGTTNSTITTLSALSLPYSQITGAPSAITALTGDGTASGPGSAALTLATVNGNVGSFTNANITVNAKGLITAAANGTGFTNPLTTTGDMIYSSSGSTAARLPIGTTGQVLEVAGGIPAWTTVSGISPLNYAQAFFSSGSTWSTTSTTFADGTNAGGNALTVRVSSGLSLSAAATNICGITFTPMNSSAVYLVIAEIGMQCSSTFNIGAQLTDGTTVIAVAPGDQINSANASQPQTLSGIYVPGTGLPVTVKVQLNTTSGTASIESGLASGTVPVEWTIIQLNTVGGTGIARSISSISSPTNAGATAATDYVYLVSGTTTLTLPTAVGNSNLYTIKNTGSATVTIATTSAQTIDGSASATLPVQYTSIDLISDGSNWNVV